MLYSIFPLAIYFTYAVHSLTLCDPIDCSPSGSSVHGDSPVKNTGWVTMPSSRGSSQRRDQTQVSRTAGDSLLSKPPGKPHIKYSYWAYNFEDFPGSTSGKEPTCQCRRCRFNPWSRKIPWRRASWPTPVFFPGESHGQRSLAGYSP